MPADSNAGDQVRFFTWRIYERPTTFPKAVVEELIMMTLISQDKMDFHDHKTGKLIDRESAATKADEIWQGRLVGFYVIGYVFDKDLGVVRYGASKYTIDNKKPGHKKTRPKVVMKSIAEGRCQKRPVTVPFPNSEDARRLIPEFVRSYIKRTGKLCGDHRVHVVPKGTAPAIVEVD